MTWPPALVLPETIVPEGSPGQTTGGIAAHEAVWKRHNAHAAHPVIYVDRAYGAACDGVTDDSDAIEAALADAISAGAISTVRQGLARVVLTGMHRITRPMRIQSVLGLRFGGLGPMTGLLVDEDMECALDLNGLAHCEIGDFSIMGNAGKLVERALWLRWGAGIARSTADNTFRNVTVRNLDYEFGFQIGEDGAGNQVDTDTWINCLARGGDDRGWAEPGETRWRDGWRVGTGVTSNNLIHTMLGCSAELNQYNLHVQATSVTWLGGKLQHGESDIRYGPGHGEHVVVKGVRSEASERLLTTDGPNGTSANVSLEEITWHANELADDNEVIQWDFGGCLTVKDLCIPQHAGKAPKIVGYSSLAYGIRLESCVSTTPVEDFITVAGDCGLVIENYTQLAADGTCLKNTTLVVNKTVWLADDGGSTTVGIKRLSADTVGVVGHIVADSEGPGGGVWIYDDTIGHISPRGGAARPLRIDGWSTIVLDDPVIVSAGSNVEIDDGLLIMSSPDGTRYRLLPPNGGGAATWVAV